MFRNRIVFFVFAPSEISEYGLSLPKHSQHNINKVLTERQMDRIKFKNIIRDHIKHATIHSFNIEIVLPSTQCFVVVDFILNRFAFVSCSSLDSSFFLCWFVSHSLASFSDLLFAPLFIYDIHTYAHTSIHSISRAFSDSEHFFQKTIFEHHNNGIK